MTRLNKVLRAVFVLPFSAGHPKERGDGESVSHDGSISGLVFLVSVVVVLCIILVLGSVGQVNDNVHISPFTITMTVTACLAIFICIALTVYASIYPAAVTLSQHWDITDKIMLRFLWLFTLTSLTYSAIYFSYHLTCFTHNYETLNIDESIACDILLFIFRVVQTGFVTRYAKYTFVSSLGLYYGLLILFLTNISVIVIAYAHEIRYFHDFTLNITGNATFPLPCDTDSSAFDVINATEDFLEPAIFEYSLLTILFISEIWPKRSETANMIRRPSCVYDNFSIIEHTGLLQSEESIYESIQDVNRPTAKHMIWKCINIAAAFLLLLPGIVLLAMRVYNKDDVSIRIASDYCNSIEITVMVLSILKCFYLLQTECKPTNKRTLFGSKDYLILVSLIGSLGYYTMRLIPYIVLVHSGEENVNRMYNYIVRILAIYLQTVLIYQLKNYEKIDNQSSFMSIEYNVLFLSVANLMTWGVNTFLASQYVFSNDAPALFYGKLVWVNSYSLLYPFAIFYRFKCFVAFYGIYDRLRK